MKGSSDLILICCGTGISIEFKPMLLIGGTVLEYIRATSSPQALSLSARVQYRYYSSVPPSQKTKNSPQPQYWCVSYQDRLLTLTLQPSPLPSQATRYQIPRGEAWLFRHLANWVLYQGYLHANFRPESRKRRSSAISTFSKSSIFNQTRNTHS